MKLILLLSGLGLLLIVVAELALRALFGFGQPPLYQGDDRIGYLLQANQRVKRFGNRIEINQYHQRTGPIAPTPPEGTRRIFIIGDSIVNGNWWTDQSDILSEVVKGLLHQADPKVAHEVLNASANSWGPRNELAYLEKFGTFGAEALVLVINTDDLFAVEPTAVPVGRDRNYPNRRPASALSELVSRYALKPKPDPLLEASRQEEGDRVQRNLDAIAQIQTIARTHNARFLMVMTPLKRELDRNGGPRDYEIRERQRLREFVQAQLIPFVDLLPILNHEIATKNIPADSLYRDHIHLSIAGNQILSERIADKLKR